MRTLPTLLTMLALTATARAALPTPPDPTTVTPFPTPWSAPDTPADKLIPGIMSATDLLDAPAGRLGPVVARDGHFFTGDKRLKLWGVNFCFAADFPTHDQADRIAPRLAHFGINAVRFHHTDNQPFPNGIFADKKLETLSPEALDRLDYLLAALKKQGIYTNLNLHVSRFWTKAHNINTPNIPGYDKIIDLFDPTLIAAQKQYARDLLTHLNPYTKTAYAAEPAICIVEINNENTFFLWGGQRDIANLPDPYATEFRTLWNTWLTKKYPTREELQTAWEKGAEQLGPNQIPTEDLFFKDLGKPGSRWGVEQHETVKLQAETLLIKNRLPPLKLTVSNADGTAWHAQLTCGGLSVKKGQFYTLSFDARADQSHTIEVGLGQAHSPWSGLGFSALAPLTKEEKHCRFGFVASADEPAARISFQLATQDGTLYLSNISLSPGGQTTLDPAENPSTNSVAILRPGDPVSPQRSYDWHDFLQQTDEAYFTSMRDYLKKDLGVKAPITGTIGLGALGTLSQSKMDFVDAHAYWDHPQFPRKSWDSKDWLINNKPMVDSPNSNALFPLAATRVHGMPFTVTEYNHGAPNEYAAETIPEIATFAALQDWDGIFLFAYSHNSNYQKDHIDSFFDIEGNPAKLAFLPAGARIFLGNAVPPLRRRSIQLNSISREQAILAAPLYYDRLYDQLRDQFNRGPKSYLGWSVALDFTGRPKPADYDALETDITWSAAGPGTGQFALEFTSDTGVFVGFPKPDQSIPLGPFHLTRIKSPYLSAVCVLTVPAKPKTYLLTLMGRAANTAMIWNEKRTSVSDQWGKSPALVETIDATLTAIPGTTIRPLDPSGQPRDPIKPTRDFNSLVDSFSLTESKSIWFKITIPDK